MWLREESLRREGNSCILTRYTIRVLRGRSYITVQLGHLWGGRSTTQQICTMMLEMLWWCWDPCTPTCVGAHGCWQIPNKEVFSTSHHHPHTLGTTMDDLFTLNHTQWLVPSTEPHPSWNTFSDCQHSPRHWAWRISGADTKETTERRGFRPTMAAPTSPAYCQSPPNPLSSYAQCQYLYLYKVLIEPIL